MGRPSDWSFTLGSTSDVLQSLGGTEQYVRMFSGKLNAILNEDHTDLTLDDIKKVPQILEDPVMILRSDTKTAVSGNINRIVVYGNATLEADKNKNTKRAIAVILELSNRNNGYTVVSVYDRNPEAARKALPHSFVVYVNKERAPRLLRRLGFENPSVTVPNNSGWGTNEENHLLVDHTGSQFRMADASYPSFKGSIYDEGSHVKVFGAPFNKIFSYEEENQPTERFSIEDDLDEAFVSDFDPAEFDREINRILDLPNDRSAEALRALERRVIGVRAEGENSAGSKA